MTAPGRPPVLRVCVLGRFWEAGLGDLVQRNIFLAVVRGAYPEAEVLQVVDTTSATRFAEFFDRPTLADRVLTCPDEGDDDPDRWAAFRTALAAECCDLCVVDPDSRGLGAEVARECGIGERAGFVGSSRSPDPALTVPVRLPRPVFGLPDLWEYASSLAAALGAAPPRPSTVVPPFPYRARPVARPQGPVVALHPGGARHWNRRWPFDRWIRLGSRLACDGVSLRLIGSGDEEEDLADLGAAVRAASGADVETWCGTSLDRLACELDSVDLLVGSDSAPAHIAAALGTATVVLYGPTMTEFMWARVYPAHTGINRRYSCQTVRNLPRGHGNRTMPCAYSCHYPYEQRSGPYPRCLTDIEVDEVLAVTRRKLGLAQGTR